MYLDFTPNIQRKEHRRGVDTYAYAQSNSVHIEAVSGHAAPDPVRYSSTPARPARMTIAIMQTRPQDWGYGIKQEFLADPDAHLFVSRESVGRAGMQRQLGIRAQNSTGVRPNIARPSAATYGSLFELGSNVYDVVG